MILAMRDEENPDTSNQQAKDIEYKLFEFFDTLLKRLQNIEWSNPNSFDPHLPVADLLLRIVRLLDSSQAAAFCSKLGGDAIHSLLFHICLYIDFNEAQRAVKNFAQLEPALFFGTWNEDTRLKNRDRLPERLISVESYACWLYRRALETLPAVVREWFEKVKDDRLKR